MTPSYFKRIIWFYYKKNKRSMPWRETRDPYKILVSEIMLQQTQVSRVIPKYEAFLEKFPRIEDLAKASLKDVLLDWQGLGYNRRGLYLKRTAETVVGKYGGKIPENIEELDSLPGIGEATASATYVYTWNKPAVFIETNIRTVFTHFFFQKNKKVSDKSILELVSKTLDFRNPREWYYALMDYGAMLKGSGVRLNKKSVAYVSQSKFQGSDRQVRGQIIKKVLASPLSESKLIKVMQIDQKRFQKIVDGLLREGLLVKKKNIFSISK